MLVILFPPKQLSILLLPPEAVIANKSLSTDAVTNIAPSTKAVMDSSAEAVSANKSLSTKAVINIAPSTEATTMAATAKPAGGSALSTEAAWDLVAMAAKLSPTVANNNTLSTEPEKEMPQKMGLFEAKIAAARSNKAAMDEVADFDDAGRLSRV